MPDTSFDPRISLAKRRTGLANFRTAQALDRTTLAWVRTTLTMGSFGFGMIAFFRTIQERNPSAASEHIHQLAIWFGKLLVLMGVVATVMAAILHWNNLQRIERGEMPRVARWPVSIVLALLMASLGIAGLWSLVAGQ